jgi:hypothetical protein
MQKKEPEVQPEQPDDDRVRSPDEPALTEYDKTLADSFPSSDPPAQP